MNKATLKAMQGSIVKWQGIIAGTVEDQGQNNCPLCKKFWVMACNGCPVHEKTLSPYCIDSPYKKWEELGIKRHKCITYQGTSIEIPEPNANGIAILSPEGLKAAQAELDFLKSLLPKDKT